MPTSEPAMKVLGLVGGLSWESTAIYYDLLNKGVRSRLGGRHSARVALWSLDFAPVEAAASAGDWTTVCAHLVDGARRVEAAGAQALMLCANTMHRQADEVQAAVSIPLIHIADVTAAALTSAGVGRPLLLATGFTMEQAFYLDRLRGHGLDPIVPEKADRAQLHRIIFDELVVGVVSDASRKAGDAMIRAGLERDGADGVILGCTELGMLWRPEAAAMPMFDTAQLHVDAGLAFAFG